MKKIKISVRAKDYNITLEDDFVDYFNKEFTRIFKDKAHLDDKDLLEAFIEMVYEKYQAEILQKEMIDKLSFVPQKK